jgi:hypothetical protein
VDYLYSLYDALVSINVPNDKARAVVDAMERAMGTTIATKANLQVLRQDLTSSINDLRHELRHEIGLVRKDMELLDDADPPARIGGEAHAGEERARSAGEGDVGEGQHGGRSVTRRAGRTLQGR